MSLVDSHNEAVAFSQHVTPGLARRTYARLSSDGVDRPQSSIGAQRRSLQSITGMLDRIGCGFLVLNRERRVIDWNAAAQNTFERHGEAADTAAELSVGLRHLIANVPVRFLPGSLSWMVIRCVGDRPVILNETGVIAPDATSIVALLDRDNRSAANPETLKRMFGLTSAETQLALRLAQGDAPLDIARIWRLSRTTIRSQLASLFAKTETKRQAELVALLGRISVLP